MRFLPVWLVFKGKVEGKTVDCKGLPLVQFSDSRASSNSSQDEAEGRITNEKGIKTSQMALSRSSIALSRLFAFAGLFDRIKECLLSKHPDIPALPTAFEVQLAV